MSKILSIALCFCFAVAVSASGAPFIPNPSSRYQSVVVASVSLNPGIVVSGTLSADDVYQGFRMDAVVDKGKITEIQSNFTLYMVIDVGQGPTCKTQYSPTFSFNTWIWLPFASYSGRDNFHGCEKFVFGYDSIYSIAACFRDSVTPQYLNVTVGVINPPLVMNLQFRAWMPGPQNAALYQRPPICPVPSSFAKASTSATTSGVISKEASVVDFVKQLDQQPKLQNDKAFHVVSKLASLVTSMIPKNSA